MTQQGRGQWVEDQAKKLEENSATRYTDAPLTVQKRIEIRRLGVAPQSGSAMQDRGFIDIQHA
ncbi:hypothetical protein Vi05172_g208 [Venturia inaequalis]|nr:hypothetical protein Vi05172_g208 [Venturia inaequalis]